VWRTRVGYAGGAAESPTYHRMGDHTECFQIDFDPGVVSYEELLEIFWQSHDATRPAHKVQYASLVLAHDDEQLATARRSGERVSRLYRRTLSTRIERLGRFWLAEDYHQKWYLRNSRLMAEFRAMYPRGHDFVESPAAMRANAHVFGSPCARVERDLPLLGLSDEAANYLRTHCR